jgi:4-amino-4-deoxy-L-arabinose transferase-like glycosyltransferase
MDQRKGPMQFIVALVPYFLGFSVYDEFSFRFLFFVANVLGLVFFYKLIKNLEGQFVAVTATLFLGLNGMMVAFGRVVQYQSLNLLFSFAGLYFLSLLNIQQHRYRNAFLGSLLVCFSILSHWDALFALPPAIFIAIKFFRNIDVSRNDRKRVFWILLIPFSCLLLPYLVFYYKNGLANPSNIAYFRTRLGLIPLSMEILVGKIKDYVGKIELYNPFIYLYALGSLSLSGLIGSKKSYPYFYWFLFSLGVFIIFISNAGTHVYNLLYPLVVLSALGAQYFYQLFKGFISKTILVLLLALFSFFAYQDYLIFADLKNDYPWDQEKIFGHETRTYNSQNLPNNIIGFPIRRGWREVDEFLASENVRNGQELPYVTNEVSSISEFYLNLNYGKAKEYYAIGVKRPLSFVTDYTFPSIKNKKTIKRIEVLGENTVRIYKVTVDEN